MTRRLLVINPNTSASTTALLEAHGRTACADRAELALATARFGATYIASEAGHAIAGHAALDAYAADVAAHGRPDAVLIGCFGDPGLFALRELADCPVTGLAEAAMREAAAQGPYAIVTGGAAWPPMLQRLAQALQLDGPLVHIETVAPSGAELAADPVRAQRVLAEACLAACRRAAPKCIIIGGAGLAGYAARLAGTVPVPLLDSVQAGMRHALALMAAPPGPRSATAQAATVGLSGELADVLAGGLAP